jgi:hypothetical protein
LGLGRKLSGTERALLSVWGRAGYLASALSVSRYHSTRTLSDCWRFALYSRRFFREIQSCLT